MKIETPFDGDDTYGFPFIFYLESSQMCNPCPINPISFYWKYFVLDFCFALSIAIGLYFLIKKLTQP